MGITRTIGSKLAPHAGDIAPGPVAEVVHQALDRAIRGFGPLDGAREAADNELEDQGGDVEKAIAKLISGHVRLSGVEGFATNLGGLATAAVTVPANISGLALLQCRMVGAIAHLRGHDLDDSRVRNAVLATMMGKEAVTGLVKKGKLPGTPYQIATLPASEVDARAAKAETKLREEQPDDAQQEPDVPKSRRKARTQLDRVVGSQVAAGLIADVGGKRLATFAGKRIPVVGGVIGAGSDAWNTRSVGHYAREQFRPV
ncbi:EcsC protein family protein [Nocardioides scoriae]|uniref:EcsC protein family protein n=1 Tax=Nocardioides scoriae TaxID=642780 RepID=A0A1H1R370_9ACTN|nr:EcsC family protein [Nocardioides scoriae]SDS30224.1 EcsC protein family protein [Nocardioides scoriae]